MTIPLTIEEWTLDSIRELITAGAFEGKTFDFKELLPHGKDNEGRERLVTSCAAFANTGGGFLIFGVSNDRTMAGDSRIVGLDIGIDFAANFAAYPSKCTPPVNYAIKSVPTGPSRSIQVVAIHKGAKCLTAIGDSKNGWRFPYRTSGGTNAYMGYEEIKNRFLEVHAYLAQISELASELDALVEGLRAIEGVRAPHVAYGRPDSSPKAPAKVDVDHISNLFTRVGSLIADRSTFDAMAKLRMSANMVNQAIESFRTKLAEIGGIPPRAAD